MIIASFFYIALRLAIPVLLGTTGAILNERVGNTNLGIEGMMYMGAFAGFYTAVATKSVILAVLAACIFGAFGAFIYAFITVTLRANQVVTGLSLTIFGQGVARFLGNTFSGGKAKSVNLPTEFSSKVSRLKIPFLSDIPFLGEAFFSYDILVYFSILVVILIYYYIFKTKIGLNLRAVGENPAAADAAGINVSLYKYVNICLGGALCGLGGAYIGMVYLNSWSNNMISGRGWISVALVIFAAWNPLRAIYGSLLFGVLSMISLQLQNKSIISSHLLDMLPYLITVIILIITSVRMRKENQQPASCGMNYFREER